MKLTKEDIEIIKYQQISIDKRGTPPIKEIESSDIHRLCDSWLKQNAEIGTLNEQIEIDKDFIKQYQAQVEGLKVQLEAAEKVIKAVTLRVHDFSCPGYCNYYDNGVEAECNCGANAYRQAIAEYEKIKAGAGSAARNLQAEQFEPVDKSPNLPISSGADGENTSRRTLKLGSEQDSGFTSPTTPQACANTSEKLAEYFHEIYERLAPKFNYHTRKASAVNWREIPENNRRLMVAVCEEIISQHIPP